MYKKFFLLFICILSANLEAFPVANEGRFHPDDVYLKHTFHELYHAWEVKKDHRHILKTPEQVMWQLHFKGAQALDFPLIYIHSASVKHALGLAPKHSRYTFQVLNRALFHQSESGRDFAQMAVAASPLAKEKSKNFELTSLAPGLWVKSKDGGIEIVSTPDYLPWNLLKKGEWIESLPNQALATEAASLLQTLFQLKNAPIADAPSLPIQERLQKLGNAFKALPYRAKPGEWISLKALAFDLPNFTPYPDMLYQELQTAYRQQDQKRLAVLLQEGYAQIAGSAYLKAKGKTLSYPTFKQLNAESLLYRYPWLAICCVLYGIAFISGILFKKPAYLFFAVAGFLLHTGILALRCFVLERPPVSNMFETVIYVPWVAMLGGFLLHLLSKERWLILSASLINVLLLLLLAVTGLNSRLDNVQAVLDSQYWLLIHVMMVVGSYGLFALAGILGHFYLLKRMFSKRETADTRALGKQILQSMYLGTALLIPGTILGGVWAAESWGRFWDWDPKESWAFISSCVYLIWIHAYRFGHIRYDGLACGAITGLMAISFTWYGVNYILGTGLHSYGFGTGGEVYYYLYLACELLFLGICFRAMASTKNTVS